MFHIFQGDSGMKGSFATRISGSSDLYQVRFVKVINFYINSELFLRERLDALTAEESK